MRHFIVALSFLSVLILSSCGFSRTMIADDEIQIQEGEYYVVQFRISEPETLTLSVSNLTSNAFEVFIFDEANYENYQNYEESFGLVLNIPGSYETTGTYALDDSGTYYLVVDNTDFGEVAPDINLSEDLVILTIEAYYE